MYSREALSPEALAGTRAGFMLWSRDMTPRCCLRVPNLLRKEILPTTTVQDIDNIHTHYPVAKEDYFKLVRYLDLPVSQSSRPPDVKSPFSSPIGGKLSSWRITMHPFESSNSTAGLFLSLSRILYQISDRFDWEKYFHFMHLALSLRPDILHAPP